MTITTEETIDFTALKSKQQDGGTATDGTPRVSSDDLEIVVGKG